MDCHKVGKLILQLRKEKKLTQLQLAQQLNISNKTVSKWECGLGCPDVTLWEELSNLLGADVSKLLRGELTPNKPDVGDIDKIKFYVCSVCGNILSSTGKANISCCGRQLQALTASSNNKEHEISVEDLGTDYYITLNHDMNKSHYISFIAYVYDERVLLHRMYPEQDAALLLPVMNRGRFYLYCVKHGFYECNFEI